MDKSDKNYLAFLKDELKKTNQEICECERRQHALEDQVTMLNETKNFAVSNRISLEKEIKTMAESS